MSRPTRGHGSTRPGSRRSVPALVTYRSRPVFPRNLALWAARKITEIPRRRHGRRRRNDDDAGVGRLSLANNVFCESRHTVAWLGLAPGVACRVFSDWLDRCAVARESMRRYLGLDSGERRHA